MAVIWQDFLSAHFGDENQWKILEDLAAKSETELNAILRPYDDDDFVSEREKDFAATRRQLNNVLDALVLLEIAYETGIADKVQIPRHDALQKLADYSGAFCRYVSNYHFHAVRILAYRQFDASWKRSTPLTDNRRVFTLAVPPTIPYTEQNQEKFSEFLGKSDLYIDSLPATSAERPPWWDKWRVARNFLGVSHPESRQSINPAGQGFIASLSETAIYELWLRGLLSREDSESRNERFLTIGDGIVEWVRWRIQFYSSLPQVLPVAKKAEDKMSNPLTARFALADMYWIARILRAHVSANAGVSYSSVCWLHLLRFRKVLTGDGLVDTPTLIDYEDQLRAIFDFVCDLVQNAVALTQRRELQYFSEENRGQGRNDDESHCAMEWRAVFDEELREIDSERSQRGYTQPFFAPGEALPTNRCNPDDYWSERLITGKQPHNRIGIALSGGGVRSATFNLGVLQGLQEFDQLSQVDYISTVSGGGFIGSWLVTNVLRAQQWLGRNSCWDESVKHLRSYSSYLAPLTGILSADTWTLAVSWIRNTLLIQLSTFTWVLATLLCGWIGRKVFLLPTNRDHPITSLTWLASVNCSWVPGWSSMRAEIAIIALLAGITVLTMLWYNFRNNLVETGKNAPQAKMVRWLAVVPAWIGSFAIAANLWSISAHWPVGGRANCALTHTHPPCDFLPEASFWSGYLEKGTDYSFILFHAWPSLLVILILKYIAIFFIGWEALKPQNRPNLSEPALALRTLWRCLWIGALCVVVLYLGLCGILDLFIWMQNNVSPIQTAGSYAFVFGPALTLLAFTSGIVLYIGLSGRSSSEAQREWWTRFGAWLTIYAVVGLALSAAAVFGPLALMKLFAPQTRHLLSTLKWSTILGWIGTVVAGLAAGSSSKTSGKKAGSSGLLLEVLARVGGLAFVVGVVLFSAWVLYALILSIATPLRYEGTNYWRVFDLAFASWLRFALIAAVILGCGWLFSWFFEINIFGFSQFYRNRIVRCYLGASRWTPGMRKPQPFTNFDFRDEADLRDLKGKLDLGELKGKFRGPFPIFNCTLNLGGSQDLTVRNRHSACFTLTPLRCGSDRPKIGYAPTGDPSSPQCFAGGVRVGQAVAISGAAASPNMGYNTSPLAALLLTMFNVRLGWWFPNPAKSRWNEPGLRYSLYYLSRELLGIADENREFLNVSDGGHFENLGIYELIRRRCTVIFAGDAECDELLEFGSLGNLVRICATDFGAQIDLDVRSIRQQKGEHSLAHSAVGTIKYSNGSIGYLIYLKASITGDEGIGIAQYRAAHPSFPHETTANQFFTEAQFESYRKLGLHIVRQTLRGISPGEYPIDVAKKLLDTIAPARTVGDAFLRHTTALNRIWDECRRERNLHSYVDELMNIHPPIAVPPASPDPHQASQELCLTLQVAQLMEDVFVDLELDDFWEHPDNRGWAIMFMRWARSERFRLYWRQINRTFGIRFEYFCSSRLGLFRDVPIARV